MTRILAVSPHLDDAVLSVGGQFAAWARGGDEVTVFTAFAGIPAPPYSPMAEMFHEMWRAEGNPFETRRAEDLNALGVLGVQARHGDFLDGLYRRTSSGEWLINDGTAPTDNTGGVEPGLAAEVTATVAEVIANVRPDIFLTCAAVGTHMDHVLTRDGALAAARAAGLAPRVWQDFPYATWSDDAWPGEAVAVPIVDEDWALKQKAIECYASQLSSLWMDGRDFHVPLNRHAAEVARAYGAHTARAELVWMTS